MNVGAAMLTMIFSVPPQQAQVTQLMEQQTENPRVGGSILPLAIIPTSMNRKRISA